MKHPFAVRSSRVFQTPLSLLLGSVFRAFNQGNDEIPHTKLNEL